MKLDEQDPMDPFPLDPTNSRDALTQGITDPSVRSGFLAGDTFPDPTSPGASAMAPQDPGGTAAMAPLPSGGSEAMAPAPPASGSVGAGLPWDPGASQPSSAPPGYHWDPNMANFEPDAAPAVSAPPTAALSGGGGASGGGSGAPSGGGVAAAPPIPSAPAVSSGSPASSSIGPDPATAAYNANLRALLLQQIQGLSAPTTADSPDVQPAISAFTTQSQRDQQSDRDALAERFYAMGNGGTALDSGGFNSAVAQEGEAAAGDRANFTGSTVYNASQAKRQQLTQMLSMATAAGQTDAAQQIQSQIAAIDAQLRSQGLTQQNSQFYSSLAQQAGQFSASLGQQNGQFGDSLGLSYAQLIAQANRDALTFGLKG